MTEEVANARIWAGFHYRFSTRVGTQMGLQIGDYVVKNMMQPVGCRGAALCERCAQLGPTEQTSQPDPAAAADLFESTRHDTSPPTISASGRGRCCAPGNIAISLGHKPIRRGRFGWSFRFRRAADTTLSVAHGRTR